ncbi:MAG: hypothetical protein LBC79_08170 [Deltaproteobacteria bacterium]|jgi:hypothetical protein|nr:hypothetical protein [Deltaproteobacteria bacterium]
MHPRIHPQKRRQAAACLGALALLCLYALCYAPYGMDSTDFGFFYGYPWRLLQGQAPYRDFYFITPPAALYWHAFWLSVTPDGIAVLAGKLGFLAELAAAAWMGTCYLARVFDCERMELPLPLLASLGFVWSVHCFPPMPWHTVDGVLFGSAALLAGISGWPVLAGICAGACMLTKQSYLLVPFAVALMVFCCRARKRESLFCLLGAMLALSAHYAVLRYLGAWEAFRVQTTGQLDIHEALKAGILIYITQNWLLPALAVAPYAIWRAPLLFSRFFPARAASSFFQRLQERPVPHILQPVPLYFLILAGVYIRTVLEVKGWIGFGDSWPTLLMVVGGLCVLFPAAFFRERLKTNAQGLSPPSPVRAAVALGAALTLSWSAGISGGYKIPAFGALPLVFCAILAHVRLGGRAHAAAWLMLVCGLVMFRVGYEYPYVFPVRPMPRASLVHDAGQVYPKARGVYVDEEMFAKLRELRTLRERYGANYKTLPAFPLAYFLNDDVPAYPAEWVMDWWIGGRVEENYQALVDHDIVVFMERDQMDVESPDAYASRRYSVPIRVSREWRRVDETERFIVLKRPE